MKDLINIFNIIKTNIFIFFVLLLFTRILGKKQLSHLTFFNYITGITIGSIASNAVNVNLSSNHDEYIALICWTILTIIIGKLTLKWRPLRNILDDEPTIVIKKGIIQEKELKALRLNVDDLLMLLRKNDVFNIKDAYYAILEPDGELSVLKNDVAMQTSKNFIATKLIIDGEILKKNLKELNLKENWLISELKKKGINNYQDVFLAEIEDDGSLYISKK